MSYLQFDIGGKPRGWKFNQEAFEIFIKKVNWEENTRAGDSYARIYAGLVANCRLTGEKVDFTWPEVCEWSDEVSTDVKNQLLDIMEKSQNYSVWMGEFKERVRQLAGSEEDKKKEQPVS